MARMHSKRHGKSKSRKPLPEEIGAPKDFDKSKIEEIINNYAKKGMEPAMIGEKLKTEHGVPYIKHYMGKRLVTIMREKGLVGSMPADLMDLMKKAVNTNAHLSKNKQDRSNALRLRRIESKIWRLTKYYIRKGVLPQGWRYDSKQAELLIKRTA
jgi:small subunit ribosomal protein S15